MKEFPIDGDENESPRRHEKRSTSHGDDRGDAGMRIVGLEGEILEPKREEVRHLRIENHARKPARLTSQLKLRRLDVVQVEVRVPQRVDEFSGAKVGDLSDHHREERVARDVEGDAEEDVRAALVKLTRQLAALHVELEHRVARREGDLIGFLRVPTRDEEPAAVRRLADVAEETRQLIHTVPLVRPVRPTSRSEVSPLMSVDGTQISLRPPEARRRLGRRPLVPDAHARILQRLHMGLAAHEPEQLVDDRLDVQRLRREQREALPQIEAHLVPEHPAGAGARAVPPVHAPVEDRAEEIEVLMFRMGRRRHGGDKN